MPDISQNILRQLANLQNERSPDDVRLRQVHLQGYILALHEAELIDEAAKLQLEQLLEQRVDQRLSAWIKRRNTASRKQSPWVHLPSKRRLAAGTRFTAIPTILPSSTVQAC